MSRNIKLGYMSFSNMRCTAKMKPFFGWENVHITWLAAQHKNRHHLNTENWHTKLVQLHSSHNRFWLEMCDKFPQIRHHFSLLLCVCVYKLASKTGNRKLVAFSLRCDTLVLNKKWLVITYASVSRNTSAKNIEFLLLFRLNIYFKSILNSRFWCMFLRQFSIHPFITGTFHNQWSDSFSHSFGVFSNDIIST